MSTCVEESFFIILLCGGELCVKSWSVCVAQFPLLQFGGDLSQSHCENDCIAAMLC